LTSATAIKRVLISKKAPPRTILGRLVAQTTRLLTAVCEPRLSEVHTMNSKHPAHCSLFPLLCRWRPRRRNINSVLQEHSWKPYMKRFQWKNSTSTLLN